MDKLLTPPLPKKKYSIIYADPPWHHTVVIRRNDPTRASSASMYYPTLSKKELCNLPIHTIADDDALLFMWVSSPMLDEAIEVGTQWGFKYITVAFVWDKQRPVVGYYTMSQCELCLMFEKGDIGVVVDECEYCLIFKKGKIPQPRGARNVRQFLSCKVGRHSEKPTEIRRRIVEMFPTQLKIELFARQRVEGWEAWGNEVEGEPLQNKVEPELQQQVLPFDMEY